MPVNRNSASGWNLPWMKRLKNAAAAAPSKQWFVIENSNAHGKAFQLAPKRVSNASGPGGRALQGLRWPSFEAPGPRKPEVARPNGSYGAGGGAAGGRGIGFVLRRVRRSGGAGGSRGSLCNSGGSGRPASQGEMGSRRAFGFCGRGGGRAAGSLEFEEQLERTEVSALDGGTVASQTAEGVAPGILLEDPAEDAGRAHRSARAGAERRGRRSVSTRSASLASRRSHL